MSFDRGDPGLAMGKGGSRKEHLFSHEDVNTNQMPVAERWLGAEMRGSALQTLSWVTLTIDPRNGQAREAVFKFGNQSHSWSQPTH